MKQILTLLVLVIFTANFLGCATKASNVDAVYVAPQKYANYTCDEIIRELRRVHRHVMEVSGQQDDAASTDTVALTVGLVLFWPALFFMIGGDKEEELAKLKGEYEALQKAALDKGCKLPEGKEAKDSKQKNQIKATKKPKKEPVRAIDNPKKPIEPIPSEEDDSEVMPPQEDLIEAMPENL